MNRLLQLFIAEDNQRLRLALRRGLEATGKVETLHDCASGEEALHWCRSQRPDALLLDVQLAGELNGIQTAAAIRREHPRLPVVFYSIQDDDAYYRDFRKSGILSHYAYVRKSNYLLPEMIVPLLLDAIAGRNFIDPEIETRVHEVRARDDHDPMTLLEPHEQTAARLLAQGLTNEQIAARLGYGDKRAVSRTNGQVYAAWGLDATSVDEKVARTRAAIIVRAGRLISWNEEGAAFVRNSEGEWTPWEGER
jgi:DNA-binding NarL/FixJ family response regulator